MSVTPGCSVKSSRRGRDDDVPYNAHQGRHNKDSVLTHIQHYREDGDYVPPNPADEPSTGMPGTQEKLARCGQQ